MIKPFFSKRPSIKIALILLVHIVIFNIYVMPELAGDVEIVPIDLQFAYTPERAYELIDSYSQSTRDEYVVGEMTKDVAYPMIYTLFMSITLMLLYPANWKLAWLPYAIFTADMLENAGIITLLLNYPAKLVLVAWTTSVFSTIKWSLAIVVMLIILWGLVRVLMNKIRKRS